MSKNDDIPMFKPTGMWAGPGKDTAPRRAPKPQPDEDVMGTPAESPNYMDLDRELFSFYTPTPRWRGHDGRSPEEPYAYAEANYDPDDQVLRELPDRYPPLWQLTATRVV